MITDNSLDEFYSLDSNPTLLNDFLSRKLKLNYYSSPMALSITEGKSSEYLILLKDRDLSLIFSLEFEAITNYSGGLIGKPYDIPRLFVSIHYYCLCQKNPEGTLHSHFPHQNSISKNGLVIEHCNNCKTNCWIPENHGLLINRPIHSLKNFNVSFLRNWLMSAGNNDPYTAELNYSKIKDDLMAITIIFNNRAARSNDLFENMVKDLFHN